MSSVDWPRYARSLADAVLAGGGDAGWVESVAAVPRHVFVPEYHVQRHGEWITTGPDDLAGVYRDEPLITALLPGADGRPVVVSSSTKPGLMVRMLAALEIEDHHDVLEIGTGTGYNAALLCHRLGQDKVTSLDIGAQLVELARARLLPLGWQPTLAVADATTDLPVGPGDRIVATCSVPRVPAGWVSALRPGGRLLVDLKIGLHAGTLVLLHREGDRLTGRFLPKWAGFMPARRSDDAPARPSRPSRDAITRTGSTLIDPDPWAAMIPWMLAQLDAPPVIHFGRWGPGLTTTVIEAADGSWSEIGPAEADGRRPSRGGGPRDLWQSIEDAHRQWAHLDRPGWERWGVTVDSDGTHTLWLDHPHHVHGPLAPADAAESTIPHARHQRHDHEDQQEPNEIAVGP